MLCFVDLQIIQYEATEFHGYCWKSICYEINKDLAFSRWGDGWFLSLLMVLVTKLLVLWIRKAYPLSFSIFLKLTEPFPFLILPSLFFFNLCPFLSPSPPWLQPKLWFFLSILITDCKTFRNVSKTTQFSTNFIFQIKYVFSGSSFLCNCLCISTSILWISHLL